MKAPNNARGTEALEQLDERAGVDDAAVGQRRQELLVRALASLELLPLFAGSVGQVAEFGRWLRS